MSLPLETSAAGKKRSATRRGGVIAREAECKSVLNKSPLGDYSLNCYTGCENACVYCYARYMQKFHPHAEPWGRFVDVKVNAPAVLRRQMRRQPPGTVFMSSACDGWQALEARYELTRECCRLLFERGFTVHALTKSKLILRDLDFFQKGKGRIGVTITTPDEHLAKLLEPKAGSAEERWGILRAARRAGVDAAVMFGPLLPHLSDGEEALDRLFQKAAEEDANVIWADALNRRPRVWPSVSSFLLKHFPGLHERYRLLLHSQDERAAYLEALGRRIRAAARKHGVEDRLAGCP